MVDVERFLSDAALNVRDFKRTLHRLNSYELLPTAEIFLKDLVREIGRATSSIDMQFHTFEADAIGKPVAQALLDARGRGINVRLMVDDYINLAHNDHYIFIPRFNRSLRRSIISEWRETNQMLATMSKNAIKVQMTNPLGILKHKALWRDHRKLVVIDSSNEDRAVVYVGGVNLSEHNYSWNDFMVKMQGDMIPVLQRDYDETWQRRNGAGITDYSDGLVVSDTCEYSVIIPLVRKLINQAEERVIIESPYLWGRSMVQALKDAAQRGVAVSVIVPLHNHHRFFVPSRNSLENMGKSGINIYRFQRNGGMTHAKALLTDNVGTFGSNNFNEFLGGKIGEVGVITDNPSLVFQLEQFLGNDMETSLKQN